ncbi:uncharacterized protein BCR38DRAFT_354922 [Pseudomassariella vexata]|uniref:1-phosphatidylinositol-3-phosphate 5-kinase n=1 Tax=Pseudomassariella vexata TaxID=1141098 RepID=A0A1Y2DDK5_9PEZI|nr:uncharacterized protein BCR38DRAFT_354922 [Pseudomassariella vexata]ORY57196.1 hypothetical protein BCR38DRAFT_354922 [Pseudomassariella vexata]
MSGKNPPQQLSPMTLPSPIAIKSRRDSLASASVASSQPDKVQLAQALDKIHTSAAQCDVLTTFNDLAPPPDATASPENKVFGGDLVQNGFSGLYSRFKEAVGAVGKEKSSVQEEVDNQDAASKRSSSTVATASKVSVGSFPRADTGMTSSTIHSTFSDPILSTAPSSGALTSEGQSLQQYQSTKASSVTNFTATSTAKSASSSRQSIPNMTKATASVAPVTVSAFKEPRSLPSRAEDASGRTSVVRKSITSRPSDGPSVGSNSDGSSMFDAAGLKSTAALEKIVVPSRSRWDEALSNDGNIDSPTSPVKISRPSVAVPTQSFPQDPNLLSPTSRLSGRDVARRPAVIDRISRPQFSRSHSRSSSLSQGAAEPSVISTSAHNSVYHESFGREDRPQRMRSGGYKIPGTTTDEGAPEVVSATLEHMRKQVLSKDFWMADETCKECFLCNAPFSAFRRKHHCRTCGCIFDSRCTSIISGQRFGVQGTLRVCKPCLNIISQRQEQDGNGSDDSADDSFLPQTLNIFRPISKSVTLSVPQDEDDVSISEKADEADDDIRTAQTPMMAIPATRRIGESSNRHSAILEIDAPQLSRPSSSRSLKSLAGRPQSSGHRRHHSKHNFLSRFKGSPAPDDRAPFRRSANEEVAKKSGLPAFHDDNVIDPDLAPFMSDESSGDEQMSIFQTMTSNEPNPSSFDQDKSNFGPYLGGGRRNRLRNQVDKSISGFSFTGRVFDDGSGAHSRPSRRRNLSTASASVHHLRSPRPKSSHLMKGPSASTETLPNYDSPGPSDSSRLTRSSSMKGDKEPRLELNPASLLHVRKLLRQLLADSDVPNAPAWEKALVPVLLKCTTSVDPDVERGDDIDIRHYVKLKKITGGRPGDTSYVSGVIFTKKLALKSMARRLTNPRVVIVSFPVEYRRHQQHFMSLQPVIDEEKEFLKVIVNRLVALRPQLLLAEKSVSGLALQYLSEAGVAVAYNVKPSVLSAVSRCLDTQIISSIDMLSLPTERFRIGKSVGFEVKTYVNEELPGRKKTYMFLSSSQEQLGCTIALRGAPTCVLEKVKRITEFMVYVVYNLKLESCLMRDSYIRLPTSEELPSNANQIIDESLLSLNNMNSVYDARQRTMSTMTLESSPPTKESTESNGGGSERTGLVTTDSILSQSLHHNNKLISLHEAHVSHDSLVPEDAPMPIYYSEMVAKYQTKILSASPFVKFSQPYLLMKAREQERRLVHLKKLRDQDIVEERGDGEKPKPQKFQLIKPHMVLETAHKAPRQIKEVLHAVHDAEYDKALYNYQTQTRQWENYIQGNLDLFEPYAHQNIVVLHSVVCTETKVPCVEPGLIVIAFYDEHAESDPSLDPDCTLGQYIEDVCYSADSTCTSNNCDRKMHDHHRTYVHGEARITVFIEQGKLRRDNIMMWSYCKICKHETAEMEMSKGTWKYSFGKYLELSFWSRGTRLVKGEEGGAWECHHDHHRDHIRYFGLQDKVIRIHYDPIDLLEIIVPRARITWKVEHDLNLKNEIFTQSQDRWTRFTSSVKSRLKAIKLDNIPSDKAEACKVEMERMTKKVQDDHVSLIRKLQDAYMNSKYYEVIPLNVILREMLEKVTEWDGLFAKFEADFLPSEKDIRRLTMIQLRKMFTDESKESLSSTDTATESTEAGEGTEKASQATVSDGDAQIESQPTEADLSQPGMNAETSPQDAVDEKPPLPSPEATLERVDPLDLATPRSPGSTVLNFSQPESLITSPQHPASRELSSPSPSEPSIPKPSTPTNTAPSTSATLEALRRRQHAVVLEAASGSNNASSESSRGTQELLKVAIPDRVSSRRVGLNASPPMVRALSQPATSISTLPRTQSAVGKKIFSTGKDKDKALVAEDSPGTEMRKVLTNDSAKSEKKIFSLRSRNGGKSSIPRFVGKKKDSRVSTLARHFEQLSREFEKERIKDRKQRAAKMTHSRAFLQRSSTKAIVEVYEDPDEAVHEPGPSVEDLLMNKDPSDPDPGINQTHETGGRPASGPVQVPPQTPSPQSPAETGRPTDETATEAETDDLTHDTSQAPSEDEQGDTDGEHSLLEGTTLEEIAQSIDSTTEIPLELPKQDKMNFMKVLTNFWAERSASEWPPLDYPLNATDHIFIDSDIIVREDEPSSLIAFALSCEDYRAKAGKFHGRRPVEVSGNGKDTEDEFNAGVMAAETNNMVTDDALEASFVRETSSHLKYQFNEGSAKMLVKIFYAEQFDALRRKCGAADRIVESLSRCLKFDSKGGKTKSVFLKTQDDRLMMKSLSPIETSAFLRFAPSYFGIMAEALFHDLPSVIAKMLGFFQVIIKNPVTNTEIKLDLLLMENLFYDRAPTRIFDLKGSMRNRKIQSTGEQNEVLLDENMVEYIYESPLFAREHSKKLLRASVWNDTLFLARQNVMDYSLMIAVDEVRKELVVGIIDCIRTYTWDKTLESWIKGRGFAGGGRNRPTVTSPKEYKSRFREAMARYILQAPNCWHQFNAPLMAARSHAEFNIAGDEPSVLDIAI